MSFSISLPTLNPTSRTDLNAGFLRPSSLNHRNVTANLRDFHHEMRLCAFTSDQCFEQVRQFSERVGRYALNFYADTRMFIRSFISMFGSTTPEDIDRRMSEVDGFQNVMVNAGGDRAARRFDRLSEETKNLFFYTTAGYIDQFRMAQDPIKAENIRLDILRECSKVIDFQRMLSAVNTFFLAFTQRSPASSEGISEPATEPGGFWGRLFRRSREAPGESVEDSRSEAPRPPVDLNIPNTAPYNREAVPADIARKGDEIARLGGAFAGAIPARFKDPVTLGFMEIPVFDASHPAVQNGLTALREALAAGGSVTTNQMNARHHMDKTSLDHHIGAGGVPRWWEAHASAACPSCRHPVRVDSLKIDTGLQDEILAFLRRS